MSFEDLARNIERSATSRIVIGALLVEIGAIAMVAMVALILSRANGLPAIGCGVLGAWAIVVGSLGYLADVDDVNGRRT